MYSFVNFKDLNTLFLVYASHDEFDICPQCRRIYWSGTHRDNILETLDKIMRSSLK
ncbi:MAG TPA: hypothetical protein ENH85_07580 [Candidatus Scalindua sp.]|nr:hypothetical protein [Candidatus Scalindua sp.]